MTLHLERRGLLSGLAAAGLAAAAPTPILAATARGPVDQTHFVPAGGLDQWISIRGDDAANPVLLVVHGGPGEAQWPQAAHYRPWERTFTVVQWDQRGAGHTYGRYGAQTPDMTLDRISADGIEIADWLRRRMGKRRIVLLGHSWGSTVATTMAHRRPDLFAAYVGTGQVGSWTGALQAKFDLLVAKARADGDTAAAEALEAAGPPDPADGEKVFAFGDRLYPQWAPADVAWVKGLRAAAPQLEAADPANNKAFVDGFRFSVEKLMPEQIKVDLPATAPTLGTAFFLIQGRDDIITPTRDAVAYFNGVKAPSKRLILIPDAGHFAFMTAPEAFLSALNGQVRPVAVRRGA